MPTTERTNGREERSEVGRGGGWREREDDTREKTSERERRTRGGGGDGESMSVDVSGNMGIEEEDSEREVESRMDGKIKLGGKRDGGRERGDIRTPPCHFMHTPLYMAWYLKPNI